MTIRGAFFIAALCLAPALSAQGPPPSLVIQLPDKPVMAVTDRPTVATHGMLAGTKMRGLLQSAFPARLHFHMELYKKNRWFDDLKGKTDWDVVVAFDPAKRLYSVRRLREQQQDDLGTYASIDDATAAVERPYVPETVARQERGAQYYYLARLEVITLDRSDLDAVQGWLHGELKPAIRGQRSPLTALREGLETAFTRVIGGDRRPYEARSGVFRVG